MVVTTFQSVSGTGAAAMDELMDQTKDLLAFRDVTTKVYPYQIAFNLLPHIGSFNEGGGLFGGSQDRERDSKDTRYAGDSGDGDDSASARVALSF